MRKYDHFMPDTTLPPVDVPLVLKVGDQTVLATRTSYVKRQDKEGSLVFKDVKGNELSGRFPWTYP